MSVINNNDVLYVVFMNVYNMCLHLVGMILYDKTHSGNEDE